MKTDELRDNPSDELKEFLGFCVEHSTLSESTVRKEFLCDDGILVVSSHAGEPVTYQVREHDEVTVPGPDGNPINVKRTPENEVKYNLIPPEDYFNGAATPSD